MTEPDDVQSGRADEARGDCQKDSQEKRRVSGWGPLICGFFCAGGLFAAAMWVAEHRKLRAWPSGSDVPLILSRTAMVMLAVAFTAMTSAKWMCYRSERLRHSASVLMKIFWALIWPILILVVVSLVWAVILAPFAEG